LKKGHNPHTNVAITPLWSAMCRTPLIDDSKAGSSPPHSKIASCTITKTPASSWTFRLAWKPMLVVSGNSAMRYDVRLVGEENGKRHTFRTADNSPGIVLPNRVVRDKVGDTFTVQIRIVNPDKGHEVGEWSETSTIHSVAKASPGQMMVTATPRPPPTPSPSSPTEPALEALPYAATRKVPVKVDKTSFHARKVTGLTCGSAVKRQGSIFDRLMSGFRRPMTA